jgi:hypothetical protein
MSFPPAPGELPARLLAGLVLSVTIGTLVLISVHDPWWLVWRAWGLVLLGVVTGAALVWAVRLPAPPVARGARFQGRQPARPGTQPYTGADNRTAGSDSGGRGGDQRALAGDLVDLLDAAPSDSLRYRIRRTLTDAGISEYAADGEVFDPERHNVVDVEWTDDPSRESRVARTLRPGFADGTHIVRAAEVLVYRGSHTSPGEQSRRTGR